jgi:hypothetical protein
MTALISDQPRTETKLNQLQQIKKFTTVVADTGDFETIREFKPKDATTNPSLIYAATQKENYNHFLEEVLVNRRNSGLNGASQIEDIIDHLLVTFGCAILKIVPGRVSTETDARFSFDVEGSIKKARRLVKLYEEQGIGRERVLIKIASTWEGILAAEQLQKEGIKCNMTLLFSLAQAVRSGRSGGATHFAVRWPHLRLVQGRQQTRLLRRGRSRGAVGEGDLHLLQEVRLRDGSDGRKFPERRPDPRARRLRSPHHQPGIDEATFRLARADRTKTEPRKRKERRRERARPVGREEIPLPRKRRCNGDGENRGRHSEVRGRYCEAGEVRRQQDQLTWKDA